MQLWQSARRTGPPSWSRRSLGPQVPVSSIPCSEQLGRLGTCPALQGLIHTHAAGIELLEQHGEVEQAFDLTPEQLCERIAHADALIIRSATQVPGTGLVPQEVPIAALRPASFNLCMSGKAENLGTVVLQVTREVFEAAKGRLKVVGRAGVGVDNVDLASATDTPLPPSMPKPCPAELCLRHQHFDTTHLPRNPTHVGQNFAATQGC